MWKGSKAKKIIASISVLTITVATVLGYNSGMAFAEEEYTPDPTKVSIEIECVSGADIEVAYALDYDGIKPDGELTWKPLTEEIFALEDGQEGFIGAWKSDWEDTRWCGFDVIPACGGEENLQSVQRVSIKLTVRGKIIPFARYHEGFDGEGIDLLGNITENNGETTLIYHAEMEEGKDTNFHLVLKYPREGDPKAKDLIEDYIYAYSDWDNDSDVDATDMRIGFATELCHKYFWEEGGLLSDKFEIVHPNDLINDPERMQVTQDGDYTAKLANGSTASYAKYRYVINLGVDYDNHPVEVSGVLYALPNKDTVLISTGEGLYLRNVQNDKIAFDKENPVDKAICVAAEFDKNAVMINGNGAGSTETNNPEKDDVYCVNLSNDRMIENCRDNYCTGMGIDVNHVESLRMGGKVRLIKPSKSYVMVNGEGETKNSPGVNSDLIDNVCQTGSEADEKYAEVFVGCSAIHLTPLNGETGVGVSGISGVALKDTTMSDGVVITKLNDDDYKVSFKSNFYNAVPLEITYDNGEKKTISIHRIGLVIDSMFLMDDGEGVRQENVLHGNEETGITFDYDYLNGQQVAVWATYYHPSNDQTSAGSDDLKLFLTYDDGTTAVLNKYSYTPATNTTVATTDFLIGFAPSHTRLDDGNWGEPLTLVQFKPFQALVMNAGYDSKTNFSGTQIGSGRGVSWDGKVEWNFN